MTNIRKYLGIPYKSRADQFDGADCYGLCVLFNRHELGKHLPDYKSLYASADDFKDAAQAFTDVVGQRVKGRENWMSVDRPELGDVLLFRQMGVISHCGIYLDGVDFLHIRAGQSAMLDNMASNTWAKRLDGVMRWQN